MAARFLGARNLFAVSRRATATNLRSSPKHFIRWQSSETPRRSVSASRVLILGLTASGVAVSGGLVYANYDPIFREKVNDYIPGFAGAADYVADKWIDFVDYFNLRSKVSTDSSTNKPLVKTEKPNSVSKEKKTVPVKTISTGESSANSFQETTTKKTPAKKKQESQQQSKKNEAHQPAINKETKSSQKTKERQQKKEMMPIQEKKEPVQTASPAVAIQTTKSELSTGSAKDDAIPTRGTKDQADLPSDATTMETTTPPSPPKVEESATPPPPDESTSMVSSNEEIKPVQKHKSELVEPASKEIDASVEGAVASVKEAAAKAAQEILSEQIKEHQAAQTSDEHFKWLKDSAQVDAKLQEVYEKFKSVSEKVLDLQKILTNAISNYHEKLTNVSQSRTDDVPAIQGVAGGVAESEEAVDEAKKNLEASRQEHNEIAEHLKSLMDEATSLGLKSKVKELQETVASLVSDLLSGAVTVAEIESNSKVLKEYQQEVEKSAEQLKGELGTALPKADSQQEAVILMLQKRVEILKERLGKMESDATQKLVLALEKQKQSLEQLAEEKLKWKLQKQEHGYRNDFEKQINEVESDYEHKLREQVRIQTDAHTQHLAESLHTQAERLESKWINELEFKLTEQETFYQTELAKAVARLRGIESMVETVANAGEQTYQQQSLRNACDSLNTALERADLNPDPIDRYTFSDEISSLCEAARGDPFILSTLDSIPTDATSKTGRGIQSEAALKERFSKVKRICKRVALVPETGGGLGTYALSYLQSLLTLSAWDITAKKMDEPDLSTLDTFGLLHQAEASLHHGDLERAIRCLNCLSGESRRVASDWLKDARLYLETRQAINLIQSYMAATSLSIIQKT